ncbi:MAG TPA: septal ring lytic transglycosylase RlpA family protein [Flavobacteriaceae bacterium]|nr:septal ring lytic transglycosylase RlpA family protein [Flavobacteriaceae bacterium]
MKGKLFLNINTSSYTLLLVLFIGISSCGPAKQIELGEASYYHNKYRGKKTASGEKFRQYKRTAAHKTLPLGTKVRVTNLDNGKKVRVTINDRGSFIEGRIIDLSRKAARKIDMLNDGVVPVKIEYKIK